MMLRSVSNSVSIANNNFFLRRKKNQLNAMPIIAAFSRVLSRLKWNVTVYFPSRPTFPEKWIHFLQLTSPYASRGYVSEHELVYLLSALNYASTSAVNNAFVCSPAAIQGG